MFGHAPKRPAPHNPYDGRRPPPAPQEDAASESPPKPCFHEYALSAQSRMSDLTGTLTRCIRWGLDSRDPRKINEEANPPNWRTALDQIAAVRGVLADVEGYCAEALTYTGLDRQPIVRDRLQQLVDKMGAPQLGFAMERLFTLDAVDLLKDQYFEKFVTWADAILVPEVTSNAAASGSAAESDDRRGFSEIEMHLERMERYPGRPSMVRGAEFLRALKDLNADAPHAAKAIVANAGIDPGTVGGVLESVIQSRNFARKVMDRIAEAQDDDFA